MAKMLLINPRRRRRTATSKRRAAPKRRRNPVALRKAAPVAAVANPRRRRRRNPVSLRRPVVRRRRNPISLGSGSRGIVGMLKDAAIGGAGSLSVDLLMGQVNPFLPASLQTRPNTLSAGDAVKAAITVVLGRALNKTTRGLSQKMAMGALITQMRDVLSVMLPATMTLGYASPARIVQGTNRVGPIRRGNISAYTRPGVTPLLSAYMQPGLSPLLNGNPNRSARAREGYLYR